MKDRCAGVWKRINFSERIVSEKKLLRIHKVLQSCLHLYKRKRGKFEVKMVQDPIFLHKESWGHGDPSSVY